MKSYPQRLASKGPAYSLYTPLQTPPTYTQAQTFPKACG